MFPNHDLHIVRNKSLRLLHQHFICKFILNAIFLPLSDNPSSDASLSVQFTLSSRLTIQNYN